MKFVIRRNDGLYAYFSAFQGVVWIEDESNATKFDSKDEAEQRVFSGAIDLEIVEASETQEAVQ